MSAVLIKYRMEVVDDDAVRSLVTASLTNASDRVEVPGLPGVSLHEAMMGMSKGYEPLDVHTLQDQVAVATMGEPPTIVLFVRESNTVDNRRK